MLLELLLCGRGCVLHSLYEAVGEMRACVEDHESQGGTVAGMSRGCRGHSLWKPTKARPEDNAVCLGPVTVTGLTNKPQTAAA
jgi:hypothetical protein